MLKAIRRLFGRQKSWDIEIAQLDNSNSFGFSKIHDKNGLLKELIRIVPENSVWSIEGLYSKDIYNILEPFIIEDKVFIRRATVFPKQNFFKIQLNQELKNTLDTIIDAWDLDVEMIHQHIYKGQTTYLNSFDNLNEACTWIANELEEKITDIEKLIEIEK